MAVIPKFIECTNPHITEDELFNSILAVDNEGNVGIRTIIVDKDPALLDGYPTCGNPNLSRLEILRATVGADAEGKAALVLFNVG